MNTPPFPSATRGPFPYIAAAQFALLDPQGRIVSVNEAWREALSRPDCPCLVCGTVGENYLTACLGSACKDDSTVQAAHQSVRAVLAGLQRDYILDYSDSSAQGRKYYSLRVAWLEGLSPGVVISHLELQFALR